ncbi:MAG: hypothetical protein H0T89_35475 [Deltaproteobacteria bacterium]|nr:hypothetical protein [Deltaproteobacteria bacterium]MDQ3301054.1 hypothetical protein [Myxococcota bacterium]
MSEPLGVKALVGSLALHVVLGLLVLELTIHHGAGERHVADRSRDVPRDVIAIEIVPGRPAPPRDITSGGGAFATAPVPSVRPVRAVSRSRRNAPRPARHELGSYAIDASQPGVATAASFGDVDGGEGTGLGGHRGSGIGFGDGGRIEVVGDLPTPPPAPAADVPSPSRARPAKLIYPSRQRDIEEGRLFVARVIVDHDGYVIGARLVRGFGGPRDDEAADLIFRFRYAPALDDAGRPIRSSFEQRFHVNR